MTQILLVRHGESEWNALGRWQGQADVPLSDLGRTQAALAAQAIGVVDAIVSSDLERASTTAAIIAEELGVGPVYLDPDLRERSAGEWSGLTRAQIHERFPGYLTDDPLHRGGIGTIEQRPPGWEPDDAVLERAERALHRMADAVPGGSVVAVTHGGLVLTVERHLGADDGRLSNLDARWITVDGADLRLGERVRLLDPDAVAITSPDGI